MVSTVGRLIIVRKCIKLHKLYMYATINHQKDIHHYNILDNGLYRLEYANHHNNDFNFPLQKLKS